MGPGGVRPVLLERRGCLVVCEPEQSCCRRAREQPWESAPLEEWHLLQSAATTTSQQGRSAMAQVEPSAEPMSPTLQKAWNHCPEAPLCC